MSLVADVPAPHTVATDCLVPVGGGGHPAAGTTHTEELIAMAGIALILVSAGLMVGAGIAWYATWRRRASAALVRVPVSTARSTPVVRRADERSESR